MPAYPPAAYGVFALVLVAAVLIVAATRVRVKLSAASRRLRGVSVYDFGADLKLPPSAHSRSYQVALYLTMKSLPREPADAPAPRVSARAASR